MVLSTLAEGLDPSAAERVFGSRQATITTWLSRAGEHAQTLHERCFRALWLPHLQLDELRTRLRSNTQVLWLWLAIDPCTKLLPVLQLGPRTQHMAHLLIHSLIPCDRSWLLVVSRSLRVTGSISISMLSRPILDTGARCVAEGAKSSGGRWQWA